MLLMIFSIISCGKSTENQKIVSGKVFYHDTLSPANGAKVFLGKNDLGFSGYYFEDFTFKVLGLKNEDQNSGNDELLDGVMTTLIELRQQAKNNKDWASADLIRNELSKLNIVLKDTKEGTDWEVDK